VDWLRTRARICGASLAPLTERSIIAYVLVCGVGAGGVTAGEIAPLNVYWPRTVIVPNWCTATVVMLLSLVMVTCGVSSYYGARQIVRCNTVLTVFGGVGGIMVV